MTYTLTITRDDQLTVELTDPSIPVIVTAMHHELLRTKTEVTRVTVTGSTTPYTLILRPDMEDPAVNAQDVEEHARELSGMLHWNADHAHT